VAERIVSLPMYAELTAEQIQVVVKAYEEKYCFWEFRVFHSRAFRKLLSGTRLGDPHENG